MFFSASQVLWDSVIYFPSCFLLTYHLIRFIRKIIYCWMPLFGWSFSYFFSYWFFQVGFFFGLLSFCTWSTIRVLLEPASRQGSKFSWIQNKYAEVIEKQQHCIQQHDDATRVLQEKAFNKIINIFEIKERTRRNSTVNKYRTGSSSKKETIIKS